MLDSIPLLTSTPGGLYLDIKSLIFSGLSPPAVKYGNDKSLSLKNLCYSRISQSKVLPVPP